MREEQRTPEAVRDSTTGATDTTSAKGTPESGRRLRVGVVFGGRSGEHEVSIASATSVINALDANRYEVIPVGITHEGRWLLGLEPQRLLQGQTMEDAAAQGQTTAVAMTGDPTRQGLVPADAGTHPAQAGHGTSGEASNALDIVLPVVHGTYGEDGTLQGLLEMAGIPYAGCGVLGSALGMDKEKAKLVFRAVGLPVVDWVIARRAEFEREPEAVIERIEGRFMYPVFVKPANLGSSVGVGKAHDRDELRGALATAFEFDRKVLVEPTIPCRELECGVLGNDAPIASIVGEVVPDREFYDYRSKYLNGQSRLFIPAEIPPETMGEIRRMAVEAFLALDLSGLARVDFFLDRETGQVYINEVNTMPGFTQISMYPKLWEASGVPYPELLNRLIQLGLERAEEKRRTRTTFSPAEEA